MQRRQKHDSMMKSYCGLCLGQNIEALSNTGMVWKWATLYDITDIFVALQKKYFEMLKMFDTTFQAIVIIFHMVFQMIFLHGCKTINFTNHYKN